MTYIAYTDWNPKPESLAQVDIANRIIREYAGDGFVLTLRQLYYQFVARGHVENTERSYKNLGTLITNARMAGLISWQGIEDRGREFKSYWFDEDDQKVIDDLPGQIRFDRWERQENYVEVWVEKEALGNVIAKACQPWLVPFMSCKGYLSASEAWRAGLRYRRALDAGKHCVLIHLGDHDPSGIDMTRDNRERLELFAEAYADDIDVRRIALNMDQVREFSPPPNPAKISDSRASKYVSRFGSESWELDAMEPSYLVDIIEGQIADLIDDDAWTATADEEEATREALQALGQSWPDIKEGLGY